MHDMVPDVCMHVPRRCCMHDACKGRLAGTGSGRTLGAAPNGRATHTMCFCCKHMRLPHSGPPYLPARVRAQKRMGKEAGVAARAQPRVLTEPPFLTLCRPRASRR